jgi:hypothetical protein
MRTVPLSLRLSAEVFFSAGNIEQQQDCGEDGET